MDRTPGERIDGARGWLARAVAGQCRAHADADRRLRNRQRAGAAGRRGDFCSDRLPRIAETAERAEEIASLVTMGKSIGFEIDHMLIDEVARRMPYMRTDDLVDACYCPTDGHLQPAELAGAYIKIGRERGVRYHTNTPVTDILIEAGRVCGVRTASGDFRAPVVVNAGGPWSYLNAEMAETVLPTAAIGHYYLTTRPNPPAQPVIASSPAVRNRELRIYTRPESGGLIVGHLRR